jgi:hypothetical protein
MHPAEWETGPAEGLAPETGRVFEGLLWAVALSAPFWMILAALLWL